MKQVGADPQGGNIIFQPAMISPPFCEFYHQCGSIGDQSVLLTWGIGMDAKVKQSYCIPNPLPLTSLRPLARMTSLTVTLSGINSCNLASTRTQTRLPEFFWTCQENAVGKLQLPVLSSFGRWPQIHCLYFFMLLLQLSSFCDLGCSQKANCS